MRKNLTRTREKYSLFSLSPRAEIHSGAIIITSKHFNMAIHYFRDCVQLLSVIPRHVLTKFQRADIFTKQLDKTNYTEQRKYFLV